MARTVHLKLTKDAEDFVKELEKKGLTERDIFAKALGLLQRAYISGRIAMVRESAVKEYGQVPSKDIEYVFKSRRAPQVRPQKTSRRYLPSVRRDQVPR